MSATVVRAAVGRVADLPDGAGRTVVVDGRPVALFRLGDEVVALDGRCRHRGGPIGDGMVADGVVTCPHHWWRYDIRTGELVGTPSVRLERFPVEVADGRVTVSVPAAPPEESWRDRLLRLAREEQR